ncbi:3-methyladenine DNA glycosylase [Microbacterium oleivorans]|uniref:3-methyladenine DNA glycosylase n=1 Tax=Microbacterium oleivorans TaxID=273677 RepID=UPI002040B8B0|nr:3-methyladenine DNA glycosylase [Microbacterium oleivorans]MCM3696544.1 3-methyladenine DNA glycosylase [Microbacterium oleivorans]
MTTLTATVLDRSEWTERMQAHTARADALTAARRRRAARGETHPVDDFLYTYYSYKPALLRRWHPGRDVALDDATDAPHGAWRWYRSEAGVVGADAEAFLIEKRPLVRAIRGILAGALGRTGSYGCFGMHEWAMVYRDRETRHPVPLRLGAAGTDAVVEAHDVRCTHIDAFRFFTPDAVPRNRFAPTRETQAAMEQPGCLHAGMDLYKWAVKLGPLAPGELLLDAFELARDIRELDMRASPYDLEAWGYAPVPVESPEGKAQYVAAQRAFTTRAQPIRAALLARIG